MLVYLSGISEKYLARSLFLEVRHKRRLPRSLPEQNGCRVQEDSFSGIADIEKLELLRRILPLNRSRLNFIELDC